MNLLVRPKGKTKKKLNSKGKVSVNATITYTPSDGQPRPLIKTVKLKKS